CVFERGMPGETYNIGGDAERRNIDVVNALCDILDRLRPRADGRSYRHLVRLVADRPGHDLRYATDASKIRRELGWEPNHTFETGLEATVRWYLDNADWWQDIRQQNYQQGRLGLIHSTAAATS